MPRTHEWCLLAVLVFFTDRYRWMMDDAFVYFRYADNLLFLGRGLTYNAGEYVEGYSSPLWMLLISALRATRFDYYALVRVSAVAIALAYGAGLIWVNRKLSPLAAPIVNFPLAASAAHYGIATHFSSGLETPLVQLLAPVYAAALLAPGHAVLQCAVALAPLVRAECGLLAALYFGFALVRLRRVPWWFLGCGVLANGGWLAFRVIYYADFLPNTFYLKDGAHWWLGRRYWFNVIVTHHWGAWLLGLAACVWFGRRHVQRELTARAVMFVAAALYALYVTRIGGDMLYHRYAALPVCLVLCACAGVVEAALAALLAKLPQLEGPRRTQLTAAGVALAIAFGFGVAYPAQLSEHPVFLPERSRKWEAVADPNWHRRHVELEYNPLRDSEDAEQQRAYGELRARGESRPLPIIVEGFCVLAWRRFDAQVIHDYALTDLALARLPRPFGRPGHKLVQVEADQEARLRKQARVWGGAWYDQPHAPKWVQRNREILALLEAKLHNRHSLRDNLRLAWTPTRLK